MRGLIAAVFLSLAACAPQPPQPSNMSSIAAFDPARFVGEWRDIETGAPWTVARSGASLTIHHPSGAGPAKVIGPGRLEVAGIEVPIWVLWVDADYRTIVLGTPDRSFAYVLNRGGTITPDRRKAAGDILAWNGYSVTAP